MAAVAPGPPNLRFSTGPLQNETPRAEHQQLPTRGVVVTLGEGPNSPFPVLTQLPAFIATTETPLAVADGAGSSGVARLGEELQRLHVLQG